MTCSLRPQVIMAHCFPPPHQGTCPQLVCCQQSRQLNRPLLRGIHACEAHLMHHPRRQRANRHTAAT